MNLVRFIAYTTSPGKGLTFGSDSSETVRFFFLIAYLNSYLTRKRNKSILFQFHFDNHLPDEVK